MVRDSLLIGIVVNVAWRAFLFDEICFLLDFDDSNGFFHDERYLLVDSVVFEFVYHMLFFSGNFIRHWAGGSVRPLVLQNVGLVNSHLI